MIEFNQRFHMCQQIEQAIKFKKVYWKLHESLMITCNVENGVCFRVSIKIYLKL